MRIHHFPRPSHATVVAYLALVVAMSGTAVAATGGPFILGATNKARQPSVLVNPAGHPLTLKAKDGYPPLKVNQTRQVPRLNADLVDGLHARQFLRALCTQPGQQGCVRVYQVSAPIQQPFGPAQSVPGAALCHRRDIALAGGFHLAEPLDRMDLVRSSFSVTSGWNVNLVPHPANAGLINPGSEVYAVCLSDDGFND
jgi:hypothetical protein